MNNDICKTLDGLKGNVLPSQTFTVPITGSKDENIGRLVCVDKARADDHELLADLTSWRRRYSKFFLTHFEPSTERTSTWLRNVVLPTEDRILFTIEKEDHERVGHIGVSNIGATSAELDNLIRGKKGGDARLVFFAELAVLRWLYFTLDLSVVSLHVFSTNRPTIALHSSVGFDLYEQKRLSKVSDGSTILYIVGATTGETVDFSYNEMRLTKERFCELQTRGDKRPA